MKQNLSNRLNEGLNDNDVSYQSVNNYLLLPKGTNAIKNLHNKIPHEGRRISKLFKTLPTSVTIGCGSSSTQKIGVQIQSSAILMGNVLNVFRYCEN